MSSLNPIPNATADVADRIGQGDDSTDANGKGTLLGMLRSLLGQGDNPTVLQLGNRRTVISQSQVRPADTTAYAIGDLIANNVTAGSVVALVFAAARAADKPITISRVRVKTDDVGGTVLNVVARVHLFRNTPVPTVGDNGAFNAAGVIASNEAEYLGFVDVTLSQQFSDQSKGFAAFALSALPKSGTVNIYGLIETRTVFTPGSAKTWHVSLEVEQG